MHFNKLTTFSVFCPLLPPEYRDLSCPQRCYFSEPQALSIFYSMSTISMQTFWLFLYFFFISLPGSRPLPSVTLEIYKDFPKFHGLFSSRYNVTYGDIICSKIYCGGEHNHENKGRLRPQRHSDGNMETWLTGETGQGHKRWWLKIT